METKEEINSLKKKKKHPVSLPIPAVYMQVYMLVYEGTILRSCSFYYYFFL